MRKIKSVSSQLGFRGFALVAVMCVIGLVGFTAISSKVATPTNANAQVATPIPTPSHVINITGQANYTVKLDMAYVTTNVSVQAQNASEAIITLTNSLNTLTGKLKGDGLTDADIQESNISIYPIYATPTITVTPTVTSTNSGKSPSTTATPVCANNAPTCNQTLKGYAASMLVTISVNDLSKLPVIVTDSSINGVSRLGSVYYAVKDSSKERDAAITQAAQSTRSEADAVATGLGVKITGVANVTVNTPIQSGTSATVSSQTHSVTIMVSYTYS